MKLLISILFTFFLCFSCSEGQKKDELPDSGEKNSIAVNEDKDEITVKEKSGTINDSDEIIEEYGESEKRSLWDEYRMAKANAAAAFEKGNIEIMTSELLLAVNYASKLNRPEIAVWQLNNIGYNSIQEFRKRSDYDNRMSQLKKMEYSQAKTKYLYETKMIIKENFQLLRNALIHLNKAFELNNQLDDDKENRAEKINRNLNFIQWVEDFVDKDE